MELDMDTSDINSEGQVLVENWGKGHKVHHPTNQVKGIGKPSLGSIKVIRKKWKHQRSLRVHLESMTSQEKEGR
jgi:hypothetical protein